MWEAREMAHNWETLKLLSLIDEAIRLDPNNATRSRQPRKRQKRTYENARKKLRYP